MPINELGNSSNISENSIVTPLLVQKHYLRSNRVEADFEEDIAMKSQIKIKKTTLSSRKFRCGL